MGDTTPIPGPSRGLSGSSNLTVWQLVYFNLILQVDSSIAALESLLLEVVAMFFFVCTV